MGATYGFKSYEQKVFDKIKSNPTFKEKAIATDIVDVDKSLDEIDRTLEYLCEILGLPFYAIPSEVKFIKFQDNPHDPESVEYILHHKPALMHYSLEDVERIVQMLEQIEPAVFSKHLTFDIYPSISHSSKGGTEEQFAIEKEYLIHHYNNLRQFFKQAARSKNYVLFEIQVKDK